MSASERHGTRSTAQGNFKLKHLWCWCSCISNITFNNPQRAPLKHTSVTIAQRFEPVCHVHGCRITNLAAAHMSNYNYQPEPASHQKRSPAIILAMTASPKQAWRGTTTLPSVSVRSLLHLSRVSHSDIGTPLHGFQPELTKWSIFGPWQQKHALQWWLQETTAITEALKPKRERNYILFQTPISHWRLKNDNRNIEKEEADYY